MSEIICVTDRKLCRIDFLTQIEKIAAAGPDTIILREKALDETEYIRLANEVLAICKKYSVPLTLHYFYNAAKKLGSDRIHLPLGVFKEMSKEEKKLFSIIGVSCHSVDDAVEAQRLGASYITAGHIFPTDCKSGLPARGLDFLSEVKSSVSIPVYAIGGINFQNAADAARSSDGICIMSGFMKSSDPCHFIKELKLHIRNINYNSNFPL